MEVREFKRMEFYKELINDDLNVCYEEMMDYVMSLYPKIKKKWNFKEEPKEK